MSRKITWLQLEQPEAEAVVIDGVVLVNLWKPTGCQTFRDHANNVFKTHLARMSVIVKRVDTQWDVRVSIGPKITARSARGEGVQMRNASRRTNTWQLEILSQLGQ